ncbi:MULTISPECIES: hypothetical protein [Parafrankia]|uniref:DUF4267 domain-containing protein n=1 Tax=Parafrankia soli TaxID=2599596 RepID=A0A1S1Q3K8_9ACTN|nr:MULTISPECIES: hypothetical protein [Parafrankia]OHV27775.1 hypothetical protein BBK14_19290 [Parafrankia soli]TCJ32342.1 hypothetical protein E0504_43165 [Parafrankia sp. BMG5.11]CAI7978098.1 conserved hypothetical protein [Frankia sp. Hr75.2]SQD93940.1 conserved hypothetical protein [Parafrankia sp. Ea1.12]
MTNRAPILLNGLTRTTVGLTALTRPVRIIRATGVDRVTAEKIAWLARLAGIRDLALGAGLLHAQLTGAPTRGWLFAGLLADAADAAVFTHATTRRQLPPAAGTAMAAAATGGVALAATTLTRHHPTNTRTGTAAPVA